MKGETISGRYHYTYEEKPSVYRLVNKVNNSVYVGSTIKPDKRLAEHRTSALSDRTQAASAELKEAFKEYGWDNFEFEILENVSEITSNGKTNNLLADRENHWLDWHIAHGYTVYNTGRAKPLPLWTAERRLAISKASMGTRQSIETKKMRGNKIIAINPYTKEAITADSGKQLGDYFVFTNRNNGQAAGKDIIKNKLTKHQLLFGEWYLFYLDKNKMKEELSRKGSTLMYTKTEIYYSILQFLYDNDPEEYSRVYNIHDTSYDNITSQFEQRDGHIVIHSRKRGYTPEFNPTSGIKEKYGFSFNKKDKNFNMN